MIFAKNDNKLFTFIVYYFDTDEQVIDSSH